MLLINNINIPWQPLHLLLDYAPLPLKHWLKEKGSLTKKLKNIYKDDFKVKVIRHHLAKASNSERKFLGNIESDASIREVLLICAGKVRVFARSVAPYSSLKGSNAEFLNLGNKPLGEFLFSHKNIRRINIEIVQMPAKHLNHITDCKYTNEQAWARRSLFHLNNRPISVCEVFLPNLSESTSHSYDEWT